MKRIVVCVIGLLAMGATALASAADIYQMNLAVTQGGVVIGKPVIRFEANKDVTLTLTPDPVSEERAVRLQINLAQATQGPANSVTVHMMVFDNVGGEWTLRSEPTVKFLIGAQASFTLGTTGITRPAMPIGVSFQVQKVTAQNAAMLGSQFPNASQMAVAPSVTPMIQPPCGCCNVGDVHCCNVVSCCEGLTGQCCTPQPCASTLDMNLQQQSVFKEEEYVVIAAVRGNGESNIDRYHHLKESAMDDRAGIGRESRRPTVIPVVGVLMA